MFVDRWIGGLIEALVDRDSRKLPWVDGTQLQGASQWMAWDFIDKSPHYAAGVASGPIDKCSYYHSNVTNTAGRLLLVHNRTYGILL